MFVFFSEFVVMTSKAYFDIIIADSLKNNCLYFEKVHHKNTHGTYLTVLQYSLYPINDQASNIGFNLFFVEFRSFLYMLFMFHFLLFQFFREAYFCVNHSVCSGLSIFLLKKYFLVILKHTCIKRKDHKGYFNIIKNNITMNLMFQIESLLWRGRGVNTRNYNC